MKGLWGRLLADHFRIQGDILVAMVGDMPTALIACVGGGSNAMGLFYPFLKLPVRMIGVEAAGKGLDSKHHAATLLKGSVGVLHGAKSYVLQDQEGQIREAHSVSAGLDYPGVGPEHAFYRDLDRIEYMAVTDAEALDAFKVLSREEGIIPALESAHALAAAFRIAPEMDGNSTLIVNLSGRGDKDLNIIYPEISLNY